MTGLHRACTSTLPAQLSSYYYEIENGLKLYEYGI